MAEQHNYGGKSYQFNQPQGTTIAGEGNQVAITYQTPPPARPRNEQILWEAVREEVESRLTKSLHNQVLINLGKEAQPQQVNNKRPWDWDVKIGTGFQASQTWPEDLAIEEIFAQTKKHLLILGAPGSGKTTTLLDLAQALLEQARTDTQAPLPVLVNLSSWQDDNQSIAHLLREEIRVKYGVSGKLGQQWIEEKTLLPLLDGLDEVAAERQEICVQRINEFLSSEQRPVAVVVCSRTEEYGLYATNLQLQGAICLKPLTLQQMQDYLQGLGQTELAISLETDAELRHLLEAPLLLSMAVLAFGETGMAPWRGLTTERERLTWLLDAYIVARLQKDYGGKAYKINKLPSIRKTRLWLKWLAGLMERQSKTEFLIEGLQPQETLQTRQEKIIFRLNYGLISGLTVGLVIGLIYGPVAGGLTVVGVAFYCLILPTYFESLTIETVEIFKISRLYEAQQKIIRTLQKEIIKNMIIGSISFFVLGMVGGLIVWLFSEANKDLLQALMNGLILGLLIGLLMGFIGLVSGFIYGLIDGLPRSVISVIKTDTKAHSKPNQGIKLSLKNSLFIGAIGLSILLLFLALLSLLFPSPFKAGIMKFYVHQAIYIIVGACVSAGGV